MNATLKKVYLGRTVGTAFHKNVKSDISYCMGYVNAIVKKVYPERILC